MGSFVELCLFNHWCMAGLTFSCQNVFPNIPEKTSHSLHVHLSYRGKYRAMYFKSLCPELPFDFPKRGRILFLPSIAIDIGTRGRHILIVANAVSLKNIEELVQDREAIWVAETCPPMRAI